MTDRIRVIGAGLAGCEAAWQIAKAGVPVDLYEMKPKKFSPAHHYAGLAELVCSNSLKAERLDSAAGLLKQEMRLFGSLTMESADQTRVPAGGALAVNRTEFSDYITQNVALACEWYRKAAEQGHEGARRQLAALGVR